MINVESNQLNQRDVSTDCFSNSSCTSLVLFLPGLCISFLSCLCLFSYLYLRCLCQDCLISTQNIVVLFNSSSEKKLGSNQRWSIWFQISSTYLSPQNPPICSPNTPLPPSIQPTNESIFGTQSITQHFDRGAEGGNGKGIGT